MSDIVDTLAQRQLMKEFNISRQQLNLIGICILKSSEGLKTRLRDILYILKVKRRSNSIVNDLIVLRENGYLLLEVKRRGMGTTMHFYSVGAKVELLNARYKELCYDLRPSRPAL